MKHLLTIMVVLATTTVAASQDQAPSWRAELEKQLLAERKCRVLYLTDVKERTEGGRQIVEARAHCDDTRAFDVKRLDRGLKFDSQECGPVAC